MKLIKKILDYTVWLSFLFTVDTNSERQHILGCDQSSRDDFHSL